MFHLLIFFWILVDQRIAASAVDAMTHAAANFVDDSGAADSVRLVAAE
jgi:hypothetical protein